MSKKKVAIVGAGNAACITALSYHLEGRVKTDHLDKIQIYYDPNTPIERVGQGTTPPVAKLISQLLYNYFAPGKNNKIKATLKSGVMYENWGKNTPSHFHPFIMPNGACHYSPHSLSERTLKSGFFEVIEKRIDDPESEIDADMIWDCRGKHERDDSLYRKLINPLNSAILANKKGVDPTHLYTRSVATPNGWTFVIPTLDGASYGYLYNDTITSKERAEKNFIELFDVVPDGHLKFDNYMVKNIFQGERTVLNGNKMCFIEPLEATSTGFYHVVGGAVWNTLFYSDRKQKESCNAWIQRDIDKIQNFILRHYSSGSKYNTPFWRYAKKLAENTWQRDIEYLQIMKASSKISSEKLWEIEINNNIPDYSQWSATSLHNWEEIV